MDELPHTQQGTPQIYFDQLNVLHSYLVDMRDASEQTRDTADEPRVHTANQQAPKLRQRDLVKQEDWRKWQKSAFLQLDTYQSQGMFGEPCTAPTTAGVFNLVWTHLIKTDSTNKKKARCTCDGSPISSQAQTLDHTYAACVDQNAARLFYAMAAMKNHVIFRADASNAFGEAPRPKQRYYVRPDDAFQQWWVQHLGKPDILQGYVVPVLRNMQGVILYHNGLDIIQTRGYVQIACASYLRCVFE